MLIQNVHNMAQAASPGRPASDSSPAAVATPSNAQVKPSASLEMPSVAVRPVSEEKLSTAQLQSALDNVNKTLKQANKNIEFSMDSETNKSVVKLVDSETGDVIRQYPSEEAIAISRAIEHVQQGLLLKQQA